MDRRSWLWRRKSSEKSPAETESSGSISSHSERFIDEQAYAINNPQSPEVTSKSVAIEEEDNDNVKILMEKLSAALMNISAKEDLVKQHAKVAEEAVSGWEKAEKEVVGLKQQLEAANKKNSGLENRVSHLDAALKECVRQLRQGREEQEQKIVEVLATKTLEWESMKSGFEGQLAELQEQLEIAKSSAASSAELDSDIRQRLETVEKENAYLKRDLLSRAEELELRILERDLSAQAAEQASKQHLESIKKVAKLEAECRRLKAIGRKGCCTNDHKSVTASSAYVESFTDSQSDIGERLLSVESDALRMESETFTSDHWTSAQATELDRNKNRMRVGRNAREPSLEINLMDDFLEMERLAALPDTESRDSYSEAGPGLEQSNSRESELKVELDTMNLKIAELEEKINELESEKANTEMSLNDCQRQLEISESQLREAHTNLQELHSQVALVHESTEELHSQLALANESNQTKEEEIKTHKAEREVAQLQLRIAESEIKGLVSKVDSLDTLVKRESTAATESKTKCQELEEELLKLKREAELKQEAELQREANRNEELKIKQERELAIAASKFAECQKTISSLGRQLRSLATLEDIFLDPEKPFDRSSAATWCPTKV